MFSDRSTVYYPEELSLLGTILDQAVQSLPPAYREVVALCDLQEMDYATVAQVIQCPIGTVRSRLHRARGLLLRKLSAVPSMAAMSRV